MKDCRFENKISKQICLHNFDRVSKNIAGFQSYKVDISEVNEHTMETTKINPLFYKSPHSKLNFCPSSE